MTDLFNLLSEDREVTLLAFTVLVTSIGIGYAFVTTSISRKVNRGEFLLHLDELMRHHDPIHRRLRPGGDWSEDSGPISAAEWADVDSYMGLFERIKVLIDSKILDIKIFRRLYGYRIHNIVANDIIRQAKLIDEAEDWSDFIALCKAIKIKIERKI